MEITTTAMTPEETVVVEEEEEAQAFSFDDRHSIVTLHFRRLRLT